VSKDHRYVLLAALLLRDRVEFHVTQISTRKSLARFSHPVWPMLSPRFSFDSKWLAFHVRNSEFSRRIYAVPFRSGHNPPESEWIPITDGTGLDRDPEWSPDGNLIYYLTDRDGFRCIAATRVHPLTKQPVGEMLYVKHLHSASRTMLVFSNTGLTAVSLARDKMFFVLGERTGNIWLMKRQPSEPQ
jgi:eukaryotic-like serine/threonine-protein kinase